MLVLEEAELDDENEAESLGEELVSSTEFQLHVLAAMRTMYKIMSPRIDLDRMGELVNETELDPEIFDKEFGNF